MRVKIISKGIPEIINGADVYVNDVSENSINGLIKVSDRLVIVGKQNAPVRTGALRASIKKWNVIKYGHRSEINIGSNLRYAGYVEWGTSKMAGFYYLTRAMQTLAAEFRTVMNSEILRAEWRMR